MAYQAVSRHEDGRPSDELPRYNEAAPGATSTGKRRAQPELEIPSYTQAVNYIHISDVGDIIGTVYHIDTDKPPAYGRFDSQEELEQAPNVYLSAKTISAEIRLSGSKKAKIDIQGCSKQTYGRTMIRIVSLLSFVLLLPRLDQVG